MFYSRSQFLPIIVWLATTSFAQAMPVSSASDKADAIVNLGDGPYPDDAAITTGGARPWYESREVARLFGGPPTSQQRADFSAAILQRVERTFQLAGVPLTLTDDPSVATDHTLSVVSNTRGALFPDAIGETMLGGSGFNFIDPVAKSAQSVDQLEWVVAHNVAHELMLALGVGEDYDTTGNFIDARNASWAMMTDPDATFSGDAARALLASGSLLGTETARAAVPQQVAPQPVPEPTGAALWTLLALGAFLMRRRRRDARSPRIPSGRASRAVAASA